MNSGLLERAVELASLDEALAEAEAGRGSAVLIYGEAGIGKSILVRTFVDEIGGRARVLAGACDDLLTPRTLGPFRDIGHEIGGPLSEAAGEASTRDAVISAVMSELARPSTVMVIEDVHWADNATLDVLRYLARRIAGLPSVLVLTYRDSDLREGHPLPRLLGAFAYRDIRRLSLRPLSRNAVAGLCSGRPAKARAVFAVTGGNPFFVTEVLATPDVSVPATVADAVMGRVHELNGDAQHSLEVLSVIPRSAERWLVEELLADMAGVKEAERRAILMSDRERIWFRHEIARRAIEESLSSTVRLENSRRVLEVLLEHGNVEFARLAHHAAEANDDEAVIRYGIAAAREATAAGSPGEAFSHYERVLARSELLDDPERATIMEESVWVLYNLYEFQEAAERARAVVELRSQLGEDLALGEALITLSRSLYMINDPVGSETTVSRALALIEPMGESPALARALSYLAAILKLTDRPEEAIVRATQALELGDRTGSRDVVAHSLNYLGCALLDLGDPSGADHLRRSIEIARAIHHHEYAQRGYTNLVESLYRIGRYDELQEAIEEGLAYARDHDFASHIYNIEAHRCMLLSLRGRWEEAEAGLRVLRRVEEPGVLASFGLSALGRLLARRGNPESEGLLEQAWKAAARTNSVQSIALAGISRVEGAWLRGDTRAAIQFGQVPLERVQGRGTERYRGQLLRYLARCGYPAKTFEGCPEEYALGIEGDWKAAAEAWFSIGAPYERALELAESLSEAEMLEALVMLDELGADPAAEMVRKRLREIGAARVPRGPQTRTKENPAGLTDRQVEVLALLSDGLTNAEIAERLVVSTRTVDHHVSAILAKLNVGSRREAARAAETLGLRVPRPVE